jgi:hypothetical protein
VYKVGDTVVVFNPPGVTEVGWKLHAPWLGPYKISVRLSPVGYVKIYLSSKLFRTSIDERVVRATSMSGGRRAFGSPTRVLYCFSGEALLLDRPPLYRKQRLFAVVDFDFAFDTST